MVEHPDPTAQRVSVTMKSNTAVVELAGVVDASSRDRLDEVLAAIRTGEPPLVWVRLDKVTRFGADGLDFLLALQRATTNWYGHFEIARASRPVQRVIDAACARSLLLPS